MRICLLLTLPCKCDVIRGMDNSELLRFEKKTKTSADREYNGTKCIEWTASRRSGYGALGVKRDGKHVVKGAHVLSYEHWVGPIPKGLTVDHLCRNRPCCNWRHLSLKTRGDNVLCGDTLSAANMVKTHCPKGHPLAGDNLLIMKRKNRPRPSRKCRTCTQESDRRRYLTPERKAQNLMNARRHLLKVKASKPPKQPRTHCKRGHLLDGDNIVTRTKGEKTHKLCRTCLTEAKRRSHYKDQGRADYVQLAQASKLSDLSMKASSIPPWTSAPCFHIESSGDFCGQSAIYMEHSAEKGHKFKSLFDLLTMVRKH